MDIEIARSFNGRKRGFDPCNERSNRSRAANLEGAKMSEENRPCLNCAGLAAAIIDAINKYKRGPAADLNTGKIIDGLHSEIVDFVEKVNDTIEEMCGVA